MFSSPDKKPKNSRRFITRLMVLVLFLGLATPVVAAAINWGAAWESVSENTINLFVHPVDQFSRAGSIAGSGLMGLLGDVLAKALEGLSWALLQVAAFFLQSMAGIMDFAIGLTIQLDLSKCVVVNVGWTAVRDLSNMFFIFALLYIAIQTILGLAGGNAKRLLAHIIIAAILINFSLFITTVVIDAGNVLAVSFWNKMQVQEGTTIRSSASSNFVEGFNLQTILAKEQAQGGTTVAITPITQAMINIGGTIFMLIAGYIFLAAALMMVTRTIALVMLMIFSPFAFMSFGLPKLERYGHDWLEKLIKQTFVAPLFIFLLYLNSVMIDKVDLLSPAAKGQTWSSVFTGESAAYVLIYNFILLIGFLIASLAIANNYAGDVGGHARGWAKSASKWAGGMAVGGTVGTTAWGMRQMSGKVGQMGKDNEELHKKAAEGGIGGAIARGKIAMYTGMTKANFDPRTTKLGQTALSGGGKINIGKAGGAGGYTATGSALSKITLGSYGYTGTDSDKRVLAIAEERYANDPKGKEAYLRANLGSVAKTKIDEETGKKVVTERFASRYDEAGAFKGQRQAIGREKDTAEAKKNLNDNIAKYAAAEKENKLSDKELDKDGRETGKTIGQAAADAIKESLGKLNSKEAAEILDNSKLQNAPVIAALNNQHLVGLNTRTDLTPETITKVTQGVVTNGTDSARKYIRSQARLGSGQFQVDAEKELERVVKDYETKKTVFNNTPNRTPEIEAGWKREEKAAKEESGKFLGMMETDEIAGLGEELITHEMLMSQYNSKVAQKIREKLKSDAYDVSVAQTLGARFGKQTPPSRDAEATTAPTTPFPTIDPNLLNT
jgi:hypothetical protein